jgi:hypothetical protein
MACDVRSRETHAFTLFQVELQAAVDPPLKKEHQIQPAHSQIIFVANWKKYFKIIRAYKSIQSDLKHEKTSFFKTPAGSHRKSPRLRATNPPKCSLQARNLLPNFSILLFPKITPMSSARVVHFSNGEPTLFLRIQCLLVCSLYSYEK